MPRYIVRYTGRGSPPAQDLERIRAVPETTILDESPRMVLVEGPAQAVEELGQLPGWVVTPEQMVPLPNPRPKLRPR